MKQYKVCDLKIQGYSCQITLPLCMIKLISNRVIQRYYVRCLPCSIPKKEKKTISNNEITL